MKLKYILLSILFPAMTILFASCFDDLNTTRLILSCIRQIKRILP